MDEREAIYGLFGSATRVDVLWAFMTHPDEWLGPRDLERIAGRSCGDVARVASQLWIAGLLEVRTLSTSDGAHSEKAKSPWKLVNRHPWVPAIRLLLENSIGTVYALRDGLKDIIGIEVAFVFGSYATSEQTRRSDVDIAIISFRDKRYFLEQVHELEKRTGKSIQFVQYTPERWIEDSAKYDTFAGKLLTKPKVFLVGDNEKLARIRSQQSVS